MTPAVPVASRDLLLGPRVCPLYAARCEGLQAIIGRDDRDRS